MMEPRWQAVWFTAALILFLLDGLDIRSRRFALASLGLACFTIPWWWATIKVGW
jgi:hypothetical protein